MDDFILPLIVIAIGLVVAATTNRTKDKIKQARRKQILKDVPHPCEMKINYMLP